jgi:hypothetical protein
MKKISILIERDTMKAGLGEDLRTMEEKCRMGTRRHPETDIMQFVAIPMLRVRPNAFPFAPRDRKRKKAKRMIKRLQWDQYTPSQFVIEKRYRARYV